MQQNILEQHEKERVSNQMQHTVCKLINQRYAGHRSKLTKQRYASSAGTVDITKFHRYRKYTSSTDTYYHHRHHKSLEVPSFHIIEDGPQLLERREVYMFHAYASLDVISRYRAVVEHPLLIDDFFHDDRRNVPLDAKEVISKFIISMRFQPLVDMIIISACHAKL